MALRKTIPVITLACLMIAQPASAFSLPDSVNVKLDEAQSIIKYGCGKACDATRNVADRVKRNKEAVLAVTALSAVAAYCIYEGVYTTRQAIPGEPSTNDHFANNKVWRRFFTAWNNGLVKLGLKTAAAVKEDAKVEALAEKIAEALTPAANAATEAQDFVAPLIVEQV